MNCKLNERFALNTSETRQFVEENGVVTLKADKTRPNPAIDELMEKLGNKAGAIPYYAIFPAGKPNQPITMDGIYTSPRPFIEALRKAGPSLTATGKRGSAGQPSVARGIPVEVSAKSG